MIKIGMMIGDRYEILEKIGTGGMSDVYKAKCHKLNRFVAVKVLKQEFGENTSFVQKFRVEAQAAAGLMHANIVNVYDVGEESGIHYIVMELVEGITLKNYIEKKSRLSVKEAVSIAIQVSMGIEAAHNNKIIHRDIKPQNIIISKEGRVKVTDFGIAKAATSNTLTSNVMGSVHYTSPEQARGGYSDAKSDIYSLGVTLFEMLTGKVPFNGETTVSIAIKHIQEEMPSPKQFVSDIPVSVEKIVLKCCQKMPDKRYKSMAELIEDLKRSLINPNEDFVKLAPAAAKTAATRANTTRPNGVRTQQNGSGTGKAVAGENVSNQPKERSEQRKPVESSKEKEEVSTTRTWDAEDVKSNVTSRKPQGENSARNNRNGKNQGRTSVRAATLEEAKKTQKSQGNKRPNNKNNEYDEKMERVTTTIMVIIVVLIGLAVLYVVARVCGLFDSNDSKQPTPPDQGIVQPDNTDNPDDTGEDDKVNQNRFQVNDVVGMLKNVARVNIEDQGFVVEFIEMESEEVPAGRVISQDPEAGAYADIGATVVITVSIGVADKFTVIPDILGKPLEEVEVLLEEANLKVGTKTSQYSEEYARGLVCSYGYPIGQPVTVKEGTPINLVLSLGPEEATYYYDMLVEVPNDINYVPGSANIMIVDASRSRILFDSGAGVMLPYSTTVTIQNASKGILILNYNTNINVQTDAGVITTTETKTVETEVTFVKETF